MGHESGEDPKHAENRLRWQQEANKGINYRLIEDSQERYALLKEQSELKIRLLIIKRKLEKFKK